MWIDINAYIGHWPFMQLKSDCNLLLKNMNKYGIDLSIISNLNGVFYKNTQSANVELYDDLKSLTLPDRKRFIPFGVINPIYAGWKHDLKECIDELGMKGIRVYPKYHDYDITDLRLIELVEMARDMGIPISFTYRIDDSRQRSWMDIDYVISTDKPEWSLKNIIPIIKEVPDAKYIILNVAQDYGGFRLKPEDMIKFKETNVLIDTSGRALNSFMTFINSNNEAINRFAFGTHYPILDYLTGMLRIESLRDSEADATKKELLRSGNTIRFLGL